MTYIRLDAFDLVPPALLLVLNGALSLAFGLGLERQLAVAALRMIVQLAHTTDGGKAVAIPRGTAPETCPARALQTWLDVSGCRFGPVFRSARWTAGATSSTTAGAATPCAVFCSGVGRKRCGRGRDLNPRAPLGRSAASRSGGGMVEMARSPAAEAPEAAAELDAWLARDPLPPVHPAGAGGPSRPDAGAGATGGAGEGNTHPARPPPDAIAERSVPKGVAEGPRSGTPARSG